MEIINPETFRGSCVVEAAHERYEELMMKRMVFCLAIGWMLFFLDGCGQTEEKQQQKEISVEKAKEIALEQVPGATEADILEFRTDQNDGRLEYEVEIYYDQKEYEFEIDGYSGDIRDKDVDSRLGE